MGKFCGICLKAAVSERFTKIENTITEIFEELRLKPVTFKDETGTPVICKKCLANLQDAFDFKCMCLDTEDIVHPLAKSGETINIKTVFLQKNTELTTTDVLDVQICRLCLKFADDGLKFSAQVENIGTVRDVLQNYLSELNLTAVEEPLVCTSCLSSLQNFTSFTASCLKLTVNCDALETKRMIKVEGEFTSSEEDKTEDWSDSIVHLGANNRKIGIKQEEIHIKSEHIDSEIIGKSYRRKKAKRITSRKRRPYKCSQCQYRGDFLSQITTHMRQHQDKSELELYSCAKCSFESKYKSSLRSHVMTHYKDSFKCNSCKFESRSESLYERHMLRHATANEPLKCPQCNFKTIYKNGLNYHLLNHKSVSEVRMLKCNDCEFTSRHRASMRNHVAVHRQLEESQKFQCEICEYSAKTKSTLRNHMITHKDPSEIKMYQCNVCAYQAKYKHIVDRHAKVHLNASEVEMYECDLCTYQSKYKCSVKVHRKIHAKK